MLCNPKGKVLLSCKTVSVKAEFLISGSAMGKMPNLALKTFQKQNQSSSAVSLKLCGWTLWAGFWSLLHQHSTQESCLDLTAIRSWCPGINPWLLYFRRSLVQVGCPTVLWWLFLGPNFVPRCLFQESYILSDYTSFCMKPPVCWMCFRLTALDFTY